MTDFTYDRSMTDRLSDRLGASWVVCDGPSVAAVRRRLVELERQVDRKESHQKRLVESAMAKLQKLGILMRSDVAGLEKPTLAISGGYEKYQSDYLKWLSFRDCLISQVELREEAARKKIAPLRGKVGEGRKAVGVPSVNKPPPPPAPVDPRAVEAKVAHKRALKRAKNDRRKLRKLQSRTKLATVKTKAFIAQVKMVAAEKKLKSVAPIRSFADVVAGKKADVAPVAVVSRTTAPEPPVVAPKAAPESSKILPKPPVKVVQEGKTGKKSKRK